MIAYFYASIATIIWGIFPLVTSAYIENINVFNIPVVAAVVAWLVHLSLFKKKAKLGTHIYRNYKRFGPKLLYIGFASSFPPFFFNLSLQYTSVMLAAIVFSFGPIISYIVFEKLLSDKGNFFTKRMLFTLSVSLLAFFFITLEKLKLADAGNLEIGFFGLLIAFVGTFFGSTVAPLSGSIGKQNYLSGVQNALATLLSFGLIRIVVSLVISLLFGDILNMTSEDFIYGFILGFVVVGMASWFNASAATVSKTSSVSLVLMFSNPLAVSFLALFTDETLSWNIVLASFLLLLAHSYKPLNKFINSRF